MAALTLKFHLAATEGKPVELWGSGKPRREFLFAEDLARVVLWAVDHYDDPETDISIAELAGVVAEAIGFEGDVRWDTTRPDGTPSRRTPAAKLKKRFDMEFMGIGAGVERAVEDFRENFPNVRG